MSVPEETVRGWLLAQPSPEAADQALQTSLKSSLGVEVKVTSELRFPVEGGFYALPVGCDLTLADEANLPQALARMEAALIPPTRTQAEDWLVMLQAACAGGRKSEAGQMVALELYAGCLSRFPADVAKTVCERLALTPRKGGNWFPTLAEINSACERLALPRQLMHRRLKTAVANHEIAADLDVCAQRVRQIEKEAIHRMRRKAVTSGYKMTEMMGAFSE